MRCLLVEPPFHTFMGFYRFYYPMGLALMAAVLREHGHECLVYDMEKAPGNAPQAWAQATVGYQSYVEALNDEAHGAWADFRRLLREYAPRVVGISTLSVKLPSALRLAAITKAWNSDCLVVAGGEHATVLPEQILANPNVDYVIRGEGEYSFLELVEALASGRPPELPPGALLRPGQTGNHGEHVPRVADLDSLPLPCLAALYHRDLYRALDFGMMLSARGCPERCSFCGVQSIMGRRLRLRSLDKVEAEIDRLVSHYKVDYLSFRDPSLLHPKERFLELSARIRAGFPALGWEAMGRFDELDRERLDEIQRSNCRVIRLGVESGSQEVLDRLRKRLDLNLVRRKAKELNTRGIRWSAYFLFGTPYETERSLEETVRLIEEVEPPFLTISRYTPIPGTALYDGMRRGRHIDVGGWAHEGNQNSAFFHADQVSEDKLKRVIEYLSASPGAGRTDSDPRFG